MIKSKILFSIIGVIAAIVAIGIVISLASNFPLSRGNDSGVFVFPRNSNPYGITLEELSEDWWQWAASMSISDHPLNDPTGEKCAMNQKGSIWFLGGTFGGDAERTCKLPAGKAIFLPVINGICTNELDHPKDEKELHDCIVNYIDKVTDAKASVDSQQISNMKEDFRVLSRAFNMTVARDGLYGMSSVTTLTQAVGYYLLLKPFSPGQHTIEISGALVNPGDTSYNFATKVTYHLIVQ